MSLRKAVTATLAVAMLGSCGIRKATATRAPLETLDDVLAPATLGALLHKHGGGHVHASAAFHVDLAGPRPAGLPASPPTVTTTTDLWLDRHGNFRLQELNDQDNGRDIVRVGNEVAVALRYGKMVRRPAQDSESARTLNEALGAPWACWEIVRRQVELNGGPAEYHLRLGRHKVALPPAFPVAAGLRKWRDTVVVKSIDGQASLDPGGGLPLGFTCMADYEAVRDRAPVEGSVAVSMSVDELGKTADIVMPESEPLHARQRTILEEKALLGGLRAAASAANKGSH